MTEIKIDRLALDGDGIGRLEDGQAAFVPYSLPGESIDARLLIQKKNHSRWLPQKVVVPSVDRIAPQCALHFQPGKSALSCGGCDWQHIPIAKQETSKRQLLIETLERIGGVENPVVLPTVSSPQSWRYRNKVQVPFGRQGQKTVAGFFAPGSHDIVDFQDCLIQPSFSVDIVQFVKRFANDSRWPIYDEDRHQGWLRHLLVRTNEAGQALVTLVTADTNFRDQDRFLSALRKRFPCVIGVHQNIQRGRTHAILGPKWIRLWGAGAINETVLDLTLACSAGSFFQVNTPVAELLYRKALDELSPRPSDVVIDLYCGVGALTLGAAKKARWAIGVESAPSSIRDAKENARANRVENVKFIEGEVERVLSSPDSSLSLANKDGNNLLILIDPPRSGCDARVLDALLRLRPARIVYVSCHPATLARDVKILSSAYRCGAFTPVDLFPQTSHIETVCRLERA